MSIPPAGILIAECSATPPSAAATLVEITERNRQLHDQSQLLMQQNFQQAGQKGHPDRCRDLLASTPISAPGLVDTDQGSAGMR